jgi:hypothetical protein
VTVQSGGLSLNQASSPALNPMAITASFSRDANRVPITTDGLVSTDSQVLVGNNATVVVPIFGFTGIIEVRGLWAVVTTTLGVNHTAAAFRINDQSAQIYLTAVGGIDISGATVGSLIEKIGLAASTLTLKSAASIFSSEPTAAETHNFSPVIIGAKSGLTTGTIEYRYATTDTPTTGAMQFFIRWLPLSSDAGVTSL